MPTNALENTPSLLLTSRAVCMQASGHRRTRIIVHMPGPQPTASRRANEKSANGRGAGKRYGVGRPRFYGGSLLKVRIKRSDVRGLSPKAW